ncbi:B12-binding domain-containing radical SAM protein [Pendulispora brunnea]|uniref:B12-binding domain-containing radical SAM protein n=1 Tax=Pendulispora brunnea TaxID=2905690 RepID=A0ABZ2K3J0_9BACT
MYRIALISPPYGAASTDSMRPIGLMAIHSYLANEFGERIEVELFDYSDCRDDDYACLDTDGIATYDLVGLCAYSTNFMIVRAWAIQIKARNHRVKTVIGGPHATALPQYLAEHHRDAFDFVVRGEGERPLSAIIRTLIDGGRPPRVAGVVYKDKLGIVSVGTTDPVKDLDTVPIPIAKVRSPYEQYLVAFDRKEKRFRKAFPFTTSRGCPFSCTFCSIRASDSKWRAVSAERLGDWIAAAKVEDPSIEHINFMDADFLIDKKRVIAIGEMFEMRHPEQTWSFSARVDDLRRLGETALRKLVSQGLRAVEVGFESGSQSMLDKMGKHVKVADNYFALAMLQRLELDVLIDFILFLPDETPEQLRESLTFIRTAGLADYLPHHHLFTALVQYPSTPLRKFYEELIGTQFSLDVLPEPVTLFTNPATKKIYQYFVCDFYPYIQRLSAMIARVDISATEMASSDRRVAQYLRIEAVSLRQLPCVVLEALLDSNDAGTLMGTTSLIEAVPWLENFDRHFDHLEELCRQRAVAA